MKRRTGPLGVGSVAALTVALALLTCGRVHAEPGRSLDPKKPAKELFGRVASPATMTAAAIGFYTHGCLAGGIALPITGKAWQVMRLSRNRNWGHPLLVQLIERLAEKAPTVGWRASSRGPLGSLAPSACLCCRSPL